MKFATTEAANGWEELCKQARGPTGDAWDNISREPRDRQNPRRQHRLQYDLATRKIDDKDLEQWQYEVTGGGRIWYCPNDLRRIVYVTWAGCGHPSKTHTDH